MATKSAFSAFKPGGSVYRSYTVNALRLLMKLHDRGLPADRMPSARAKRIFKNWDREMLERYVSSNGTELPHDQICQLRTPDPLEPKTVDGVAPEHRLADDELVQFYRDGYLKPFKAFDPDYIAAFGERLLERRKQPSRVYPGGDPDRDRHLEMPEMMRLICHPAITDRCAQLLGPDLLAWRSQVFNKPPGNTPVGWHQASTYMFEESFDEPSVFPRDRDELFMLTVWIPCQPSTRENGCLKVYSGSARERTKYMRLGGDVGFHAVNYEPTYEVPEDRVHYVTMEPGEVLIFTERAIHGSDPNGSGKTRLAFNFRVVPTDVQVYSPDKKVHRAAQMNRTYDLANWRPVVIRGTDEAKANRSVPASEYDGGGVPGEPDRDAGASGETRDEAATESLVDAGGLTVAAT